MNTWKTILSFEDEPSINHRYRVEEFVELVEPGQYWSLGEYPGIVIAIHSVSGPRKPSVNNRHGIQLQYTYAPDDMPDVLHVRDKLRRFLPIEGESYGYYYKGKFSTQ